MILHEYYRKQILISYIVSVSLWKLAKVFSVKLAYSWRQFYLERYLCVPVISINLKTNFGKCIPAHVYRRSLNCIITHFDRTQLNKSKQKKTKLPLAIAASYSRSSTHDQV